MFQFSFTKNSSALQKWKTRLTEFADIKYHNAKIDVPDEAGIELVAYRLFCEHISESIPEHEIIRKTELEHRYLKTYSTFLGNFNGLMEVNKGNKFSNPAKTGTKLHSSGKIHFSTYRRTY